MPSTKSQEEATSEEEVAPEPEAKSRPAAVTPREGDDVDPESMEHIISDAEAVSLAQAAENSNTSIDNGALNLRMSRS